MSPFLAGRAPRSTHRGHVHTERSTYASSAHGTPAAAATPTPPSKAKEKINKITKAPKLKMVQ